MERTAGLAALVLFLIASSSATNLSSLVLAASSSVGFCRSETGGISFVAGGGGAAEALGNGIAVMSGDGFCAVAAG
jgi:hypothetical protein